MIREWRGWVSATSLERVRNGAHHLGVDAVGKDFSDIEGGVQVRVLTRVEGEPDGLPVGSMSNMGKIANPPQRGSGEYYWWQPVERDDGMIQEFQVDILKPAPEPKKRCAIVIDGLDPSDVDMAVVRRLFTNARVVDASTLGEGGRE